MRLSVYTVEPIVWDELILSSRRLVRLLYKYSYWDLSSYLATFHFVTWEKITFYFERKTTMRINAFSTFQIQGENTSGGASNLKYRGMTNTIITIIKEEGPKSLFRGLNAGIQRQICFCGIRIGLYDNVRKFYGKSYIILNNFFMIIFFGIHL